MSLLKHQDSQNWYFRFVLNGKIHFGSTKTQNKALAAKVERAKYEAALARAELGDKETITTHDALQTYLHTQENAGEYRNIKTYITKLLGSKKDSRTHDDTIIKIHGLDGDQLFHEIDNTDIQKLILARRKEKNANATILLELVQLSKTIRLIDKLGFLTPNINLKELKQENQLKPSKNKLRYLSTEEEQRLMVQLDPATAKNDELKAERADMRDLVVCLLGTGARYSEVAALKWSDINLDEKQVNLYRTKTDNTSVLSMTNRVHRMLTDRSAAKREGQVYVFEDSSKTTFRKYAPKSFVDACKRAKIEGVSLHTLRHTFASRLVQLGASLYEVQSLLGHSSATTTQRYAHLAKNDAATKAAKLLDNA
jgi:integrase